MPCTRSPWSCRGYPKTRRRCTNKRSPGSPWRSSLSVSYAQLRGIWSAGGCAGTLSLSVGESAYTLFECVACKNRLSLDRLYLPEELVVWFMSDHSKVKHGVYEEVLVMSNTNMILVIKKSLEDCVLCFPPSPLLQPV